MGTSKYNNFKKYILLTYVLNKPGVLSKVANLIRRKMYNIDTLTVSDTGKVEVSGMTITLTSDNADHVKQMMKQIAKLPEVISIKALGASKSYWREVALIKCKLPEYRLKYIVDIYKAEILYKKGNIYILQIAGTPKRIDACIGEISMSNIIDISRSGVTAMEQEGVSPDFS